LVLGPELVVGVSCGRPRAQKERKLAMAAFRKLANLGLALVLATALGAGLASEEETAVRVSLSRRADNGPYGKSAYSFRLASQEPSQHRNYVDLVYSGCGQLHVSPHGGLKNRITKVAAKKLRDVKTTPDGSWQTYCIEPEKGAVYVLDIDDGSARQKVKFLITDVSDQEVKLEWALHREPPGAEAGTMGECGGPHECR
jgi:hypothetical protein